MPCPLVLYHKAKYSGVLPFNISYVKKFEETRELAGRRVLLPTQDLYVRR